MRFAWIEVLVGLPPMLNIVIKITLLLVLGWLIHFGLRRRNPRWRVVLWRGVILGVVALPMLGMVLPEFRLAILPLKEPEITPVLVTIQRGAVRVGFAASFGGDRFGWAPLPATGAEEPAVSNASSTSPPGIGVMEWVRAHYGYLLGSVWAVIAVVLILFAVKAHNRSRRIVRRCRPAPHWARAMLERIAADLKCKRDVALRCSAEVRSPLLTGVFKPSIILPQSMVKEDSAADVEGVLAHELAHLKSGDLLWSRLLQAISIILWFHPLVWRIRAAHATACEEACDAVAAQYVGDREVYSGTLARVALGLLAKRRALAGIPMARRPQIRRRLTMLKKKIWASQLHRRLAVVLLLTGVIVLAGLAGLKLTRAENGSAYGSERATSRRGPAEPGEPGSRVVHFPRARSLGTLKVKDASIDRQADVLDFGRAEYEGWDDLGQAMGDVAVPANKLLGLWVRPAAFKDLSPLRRLRPNDLHILWISGRPDGVKPDDRCMVHLSGLTGLKVLMLNNTNVTDRGLGWIRGLRSLTKFYLKSERLTDAGMTSLADLRSLQILEVMSSGITDAGLRPLAQLRSLRELYIWSSKIRGPGLVHLAKLPSLTNLNLASNHLGDEGLTYLKNIPSVEKLNLDGMSNLTGAGLAHVATLSQLKDLNVGRTPITDGDLAHLSKLTKLESLNLYNTQTTDEGLVHLKRLRSLKRLKVRTKGEITDKGVAHLTEIKSLEHLDLPNWGITDEGLAHVAELSRLKYLWVGGSSRSPITDAGVGHLVKLRGLEILRIGGTGITDVGMSHIAKLTNLKDLSLFCAPQVTNDGLAELKTLKSLTRLSLGRRTSISIAGLAHLNRLPELKYFRVSNIRQDNSGLNIAGLTQLEDLSFFVARDQSLRDEDLACLAKLTRLRNLQLGPHESAISDAGIKHLAGLTSLRFLNAGGRHLTDRGLRYLGNMRNLWHLRITGDFTNRGLRYLEPLERLSILSITSDNAFTSRALDRLRRKLPSLQNLNVVP